MVWPNSWALYTASTSSMVRGKTDKDWGDEKFSVPYERTRERRLPLKYISVLSRRRSSSVCTTTRTRVCSSTVGHT